MAIESDSTEIVFAEDHEGAWKRSLRLDLGASVLVNPRKGVLWRSLGSTSHEDLTDALSNLTIEAPIPPRVRLQMHVSEGDIAPDFRFDYGAGADVAFRTIRGRPALVTFFKSWSEPSRDELLRLQRLDSDPANRDRIILAVCDGEGEEEARQVSERLNLSYRVLSDPARQIASRFGVLAWPTTVSIDSSVAINQIRTGLVPSSKGY